MDQHWHSIPADAYIRLDAAGTCGHRCFESCKCIFRYHRMIATMIKVLEKHQVGHRIIVTSFLHDVVAVCASSLELNCGLLLANRPLTLSSLLADFNRDGNPRINHIVWNYEVLDETLLKQAAEDGYRNFVYGPVTSAEHDRCRELNVDGIITDYPLLVQNA